MSGLALPRCRIHVEPSAYGLFVAVTVERIRDGRRITTTMAKPPEADHPMILKMKRSLTHD